MSARTGKKDDPLPAELLKKLTSTDRFAVEHFADCGARYYNPLLGRNEGETFGNIESVMQMLHAVLNPEKDVELYEIQYGLRLMTEMVWCAAQYESNRLRQIEGSAP